MSRVVTLSFYLLKELSRSLLVVVPPALTLALYRVFFLYGSDVPYFASVGAVMLGFVCLVTTLILAGIANRAAMYPLLARLPRRSELIAAIVATALGITVLLALLFALWARWQDAVMYSTLDGLQISLRWLAVFVFIIAFGLHMSKLVSRAGSNLLAYVVLIAVLVAYERLDFPESALLDALELAVTAIMTPLTTTIVGGPDLFSPLRYVLMLALTFGYAGVLLLLALWLFRRKDLLWAE